MGAGANGLQAMLPIQGGTGTLQTLSRGAPVDFTTKTIEGVEYAVFTATAGAYTATYDVDTLAPTVVSTVPANGAAGVNPAAAVSATFSEAMSASTINTTTFTLHAAGATEDVTATVSYASGVATLTPAAALTSEMTYTATLGTAITDVAGNPLSPAPYSWTFTTAAAPTTFTIFGDTPGTTQNVDSGDYELGVKFQTSVNGSITGVRFYKPAGTTGTHIGKLWTGGGVLLASATFVETDSGWQTVSFSSPIAVSAGTTYVASYSWPSGSYYPYQANAFSTTGVTNGPLTALQSGTDGPNGVYNDSPGSFPQTGNGANYWVDLVFDTHVDSTLPTVTDRSPAPSATDVAIGTDVTVTFSEPVDPATITSSTFILRAQGVETDVPAVVAYSGTTATLNPGTDLAPEHGVHGHRGRDGRRPRRQPARHSGDLVLHDRRGPRVQLPVLDLAVDCNADQPGGDGQQPADRDRRQVPVRDRRLDHRDPLLQGRGEHRHPRRPPVVDRRHASSPRPPSPPRPPRAGSRSASSRPSRSRPTRPTSPRTTRRVATSRSTRATSPPPGLTARRSRPSRPGWTGPNGVYKYGASGFPDGGNTANYWVDVVFDTEVDTTAPTITGPLACPGRHRTSPSARTSR